MYSLQQCMRILPHNLISRIYVKLTDFCRAFGESWCVGVVLLCFSHYKWSWASLHMFNSGLCYSLGLPVYVGCPFSYLAVDFFLSFFFFILTTKNSLYVGNISPILHELQIFFPNFSFVWLCLWYVLLYRFLFGSWTKLSKKPSTQVVK